MPIITPGMVQRICLICGKVYWCKRSPGRKYCSQSCYHENSRRDAPARFWAMVSREPHPKGCWAWQGSTTEGGYGQCTYLGKHEKAHRRAYILTNGPIPIGMSVLHRCDNPPCCNPDHLFKGTLVDNSQDSSNKRRLAQQNGYGRGKLTSVEVGEIRTKFEGGATQAALAEEYNVTFQNIHRIVRYKSWPGIKSPHARSRTIQTDRGGPVGSR